ncbi:D-Lactate dehydrogenase, cytochrome c-dependent [hydrothermal vent metagenome]|uniref:D-lactate dehydrogenase (cytochrome) n=1 Tax=hydrothermal vent metagenome TaxID=652676 RepID=A0A3B0SY81_9ZZZZ
MTQAGRREKPEAHAVEAMLGVLSARFGNRITTSGAVCEQHGNDLTWSKGHPPDAVFFAQSTEEVVEAVRACAAHDVPIVPYGAGTSLEGHIAALYGGLCIDVSQMDAVLQVNAEDLDCRVQAGVTRAGLNTHLRATGLFFPIDPGADATVGGMAATRASGTNAVRYGTMRENVLNLTVVMADGEVIRTARRARKSSAGYDLTRLFVGSEGTLGVITEVGLRLQGIPEAISGGVCAFDNLKGACDAVILTIQSGIPVARIELVDAVTIEAICAYSKLDLPASPHLFVEFHGTEAAVKEQSAMFGEIAGDCGGGDFNWTTRAEERTKLWQARHDTFYAVIAQKPGWKALATDVCVPISRLAECVTQTQNDLEETGLYGPIVGHAGDGNFHVSLMFDARDAEAGAQLRGFLDRLAARALAMDGTCTGEHGIGQGKLKYLRAEHGSAVDVMAAIKAALDPRNIMNPGKTVIA